ncbi:MAG: polyketide cyclase [Rhodospirillales bacterium]|nr:polyketide cyclase [Rhodospirillales bacterium]
MVLEPEASMAAEADQKTLVITRMFDAPPALVFQAWTDRAHVLNWLGPRDYPVVSFEHDFRIGGAWRGCLHSLDGSRTLWQGGVYREIEAPTRLAYTFAWDDSPQTLITVDFLAHDGKTRMIFTQTPFETTERREGHRTGWNSSFDRLQDLVRTQARTETGAS